VRIGPVTSSILMHEKTTPRRVGKGSQMTTRKQWAREFDAMPPEKQAAGVHLYHLGASAASRRKEVTYTDAAASLKGAGLKYANPRGIGPALDALAGVCGTLDVPDLSALFRPIATFTSSRWKPGEKEVERDACYAHASWPHPPQPLRD
jgi:hypothetical protein